MTQIRKKRIILHVPLPSETSANEGSGELYTAISEHSVDSTDVDAIFNQQDPEDSFAQAIVCLITVSGTTYEITLLPGPIQKGVHRGKLVNFRNVDYVRTEKNSLPMVFKNQFLHFTNSFAPRVHFYSFLPEEEDIESTSMVTTPGFLDPDKMGLVIHWGKFVA